MAGGLKKESIDAQLSGTDEPSEGLVGISLTCVWSSQGCLTLKVTG